MDTFKKSFIQKSYSLHNQTDFNLFAMNGLKINELKFSSLLCKNNEVNWRK